MKTPATVTGIATPTDGALLGLFLDRHDAAGQAAFAQLVRRHGAMVLAVCRSALRSEADAEDAAQAAFLTLARKARSLRQHPSLAGWLHRVAWFAASHTRRAALARQRHEQEAARMNPLSTPSEAHVPMDLVHESLAGLPEKYRLPMVLHYVERREAAEVAGLLGISPGALAVRLTRGREKLRRRLAPAMRGASVLSMTAVLGVIGAPAEAQIPAAFVNQTIQNAAAALAGQTVATSIVTISQGAMHMLFVAKMKLAALATATVMLVGGAGVGTVLVAAAPQRGRPEGPPPAQPTPPTALAEAKTTAPTGPYHAGCLKFTTPGKQAVELFIQFRDGRGLASHVLVDGKFYSPGGIGQHGDAPNVALDNVEGLRFDGTKLQGDWKWVRGAVETIPFDATVRDGIVTGKAGQVGLTGWLRSEAQMAKVNGLAPERNWPSRTGPREDWSGIDTGAKLTTDFSKSLLVWFSEAEFGGGRETRQCPLRWLSGSWSPIVAEGRIFFIHQQPAGDVIDDAALKKTQGLLDKLLARPNVLLDPAVRRAKERGAQYWARVDADDVIVCVDGASGKTVWETVLPGRSFNTAPYNKHADQTRTGCYGDGKVFMLGRTFRLYACDAKTGKLLWESALPKIHGEAEADKLKALANRKQFGIDKYPPLHFADGVVFAATLKGEVAGFEAGTGKLLWTTPGTTPGVWKHEGVARVLVTRGAGTAGGSVACVELKTGKELWTAPVEGGGAFRGNPAVESSFQLRLLGSCLVTIYVGKTDASYLVGYKVEPTGLKKLWKQTYEKGHLHSNNVMTMHKGLLYTKLISANGMTLVAMEPETGKIVAQADLGAAGSGRNGVLIVNDGLAIVQKDGSHPSGQGPDNVQVYRLPDLAPAGAILQTHNTTGGYDTPMAFQYVDGRLIIRGCNRIACYDLRQKD